MGSGAHRIKDDVVEIKREVGEVRVLVVETVPLVSIVRIVVVERCMLIIP